MNKPELIKTTPKKASELKFLWIRSHQNIYQAIWSSYEATAADISLQD